MEGYHYCHTTALLCLPSVVPWVQVLLSWGPIPVLLDPSHLVHCDRMACIRHRPSEGGVLQTETIMNELLPVVTSKGEKPVFGHLHQYVPSVITH